MPPECNKCGKSLWRPSRKVPLVCPAGCDQSSTESDLPKREPDGRSALGGWEPTPTCGIAGCTGKHYPQQHNEIVESELSEPPHPSGRSWAEITSEMQRKLDTLKAERKELRNRIAKLEGQTQYER